MQRLRRLLGGQREQDAENDNPHLAKKGAPAVQRLEEMEVHAPLQLLRKRNRSTDVRNVASASLRCDRQEWVQTAASGLGRWQT